MLATASVAIWSGLPVFGPVTPLVMVVIAATAARATLRRSDYNPITVSVNIPLGHSFVHPMAKVQPSPASARRQFPFF